MSNFDDLLPIAPSANVGEETRLAQRRGGEREEQPSPNIGSRCDSSVKWLTENLAALLDSNHFVERHGVPLQRYRNF